MAAARGGAEARWAPPLPAPVPASGRGAGGGNAGRRAVLLLLAAARWRCGAAGQDLGTCARSGDGGRECASGDLALGELGEDACPGGSTPVRDSASCRIAAAALSAPFQEDFVEEGAECHWCGGCQPQCVRLVPDHGKFARWVCRRAPLVEPGPAAPPPPARRDQGWPGCQERDTVIRDGGQALFANLEALGAIVGCYLDDCLHTDKFAVAEVESCAKVCRSVPGCAWWVRGDEEGQAKCWFRTGDRGREAAEGWTSGRRGCAPPGTEALAMGNGECWSEGFGYGSCCDPGYGPNGNAECWDGAYTFDRCCFPPDEL